MMELTINGTVYQFNFGMGFLREINKAVRVPVDGLKGVEKNIGLQYMVASAVDGDLEAIVTVLDAANKGMKPRVTRDMLDGFIDDPDTDVDALAAEMLDFLSKANATKKTVTVLLDEVEKQKAIQ